jgi:DNA-binding transcriptional regulator YiaG
MPNIASVLKDEISRISRKEMRRETSSLKKSSTTHRSEIAALKRRVQELERQLRRLGRAGESSGPAAANEESVSPGTRFSARSIAAQRKRLGLSAVECGLLIGASAQSIYNWEEGKARPRAQHLPAIFALRKPGSTRSERDSGEPQSCLAESCKTLGVEIEFLEVADLAAYELLVRELARRKIEAAEQMPDTAVDLQLPIVSLRSCRSQWPAG